jgi:predicted nucleic acid-binding protein
VTVFVDTSALYALLDESDSRHAEAASVLASLRGTDLVTHAYILVETLAVVGRRLGWGAVTRLIDSLLPILDVRPVDEELHRVALAAYRESGSNRVSLVDRTSFALMRREQLTTAFAFDDDFDREGFGLATA